MKRTLPVVAVLAIALGFGCDASKSGKQTSDVPTSPDVAAPPPIRLVIFVDETRSNTGARIAPLRRVAFEPLFARLKESGGELAVGRIRDHSDAPLARLFIGEPPPGVAPSVRSSRANVFAKATEQRRIDAERLRQEAGRARWRADAAARIALFCGEIDPMLSATADAPRTDIQSALVRASVFASEQATFRQPPRTVILLMTDGLDTVNTAPPPLMGGDAEVILVNGVGSVGYLAPLHPLRFESTDAAIRYVLGEGGRHAQP